MPLVPSILPEVQQLTQGGQTTPTLQEVMANQLARASSRLDINAKAHRQESLELLGQLVRLLETRRTVRSDKVKSFEGLLVQVRRFRLDHLDSHDTQRPDVNLVAILLLLDDLGRHPVRCSDHGCALGALFGELGAETKIRW
jgi:hypothetical protein